MDDKVFLSLLLILVGLLTYAFRNRPNPFVGVRFGYTYLSKEAWRKVNTFAGIYCVLVGLILLAIATTLNPPNSIFIAIFVVSILTLMILTYKIAKEAYEKEDMKSPVGKARPLRAIDIKTYVLFQFIPAIIYFLILLVFWDKLPEKFAIHFDFNGEPNNYADKFTGAILIPLFAMSIMPILSALTSEEPMLIRFPIYGKGQRAVLTFLTVLQTFVAVSVILVLLFNIGLIEGKIISWFVMGFLAIILIWIGWIWRFTR